MDNQLNSGINEINEITENIVTIDDVDIKTYLEHIRSDMVQVLRMIGK